jgi:hypothetical protein
MKKIPIIGLLLGLIIFLTSQTPPPQGQSQGGAPRPQRPPVNQDSLNAERDKAVKGVLETIKGKELVAADSVFKNIKVLKGQSAEKMLNIMNSWSKAMGTGCNGCHDMKDYASDKKDEMETARAMVGMTQTLNTDLLQKIKGLEKEKVGCITCHRGRKHPDAR